MAKSQPTGGMCFALPCPNRAQSPEAISLCPLTAHPMWPIPQREDILRGKLTHVGVIMQVGLPP